MLKKRLVELLLPVLLLSLILAACRGGRGAPAQVPGDQPTAGAEAGAPSEEPGTPTPEPRQEVVLCAGPRPDNLLTGGGPVAQAVAQLAFARPVIFGDDYEADGSDLLTELPNVEAGTLRRNDDGTLTVTLRYRDDLVWSDGEPFTVEDALLGLQLPVNDVLRPAIEVLDADVVDDHTVEVTLSEDAEYPYVPLQPPLPVHVLGETIDPAVLADADVLSTVLGPYVLAADEGDMLRFEANPQHPRADSLVPTVTVLFLADAEQIARELDGGACDVALGGLSVEVLPQQVTLHTSAGQIHEELILNTYTADSGRPAYFADARVRRALAQGINRAALAEALGGAGAAVMDSWLPPDHWAHPGADGLTQHPFDPGAAAALLDEAGWRDQDGDGVREYHGPGGLYSCLRGEWTVEPGTPPAPELIVPAGDTFREQIAARIADDLAQIGVRVTVLPTPADTLYSADGPLVRRGFDMALLASITRPDPGGVSRWVGAEVFLNPLTREPAHRWDLEERWLRGEQMIERVAYSNIPGPDNTYLGQNFAGWCHEEADFTTVRANLLTRNQAERQALYGQQQAIFTQEMPVVPLFARPRLAASQPDVCGIAFGPVDPVTWNIAEWTYEEGGCGG